MNKGSDTRAERLFHCDERILLLQKLLKIVLITCDKN